mmetsp:Transcript_79020/g.212101  ORF Transcript_79020/g.212101 Transcript_79020/m.212101 type:complete len:234 (-) Transcript_79020:56-757(-)
MKKVPPLVQMPRLTGSRDGQRWCRTALRAPSAPTRMSPISWVPSSKWATTPEEVSSYRKNRFPYWTLHETGSCRTISFRSSARSTKLQTNFPSKSTMRPFVILRNGLDILLPVMQKFRGPFGDNKLLIDEHPMSLDRIFTASCFNPITSPWFRDDMYPSLSNRTTSNPGIFERACANPVPPIPAPTIKTRIVLTTKKMFMGIEHNKFFHPHSTDNMRTRVLGRLHRSCKGHYI